MTAEFSFDPSDVDEFEAATATPGFLIVALLDLIALSAYFIAWPHEIDPAPEIVPSSRIEDPEAVLTRVELPPTVPRSPDRPDPIRPEPAGRTASDARSESVAELTAPKKRPEIQPATRSLPLPKPWTVASVALRDAAASTLRAAAEPAEAKLARRTLVATAPMPPIWSPRYPVEASKAKDLTPAVPPALLSRASRSGVTPAAVRPRDVVAKPAELVARVERPVARLRDAPVVTRTVRPRRESPAVQRGLSYLANMQAEDGTWGRVEARAKYGDVFVGKTGLCLLAFLGAGHSPQSKTEHSLVALRAMHALLVTQRDSGHFGRSTAYSHGIATYALAECFAMTGSDRLRDPLRRAVAWIIKNQHASGGWGYYSDSFDAADALPRSATSSWQIMALEAARRAGLDVPETARTRAKTFLLASYDKANGYFLYNRDPVRLRSRVRTLPASTPASVFCLDLLGVDVSDARLAAGVRYTLSRKPQRYRRASSQDFLARGAGSPYFWYYGTLACVAAGGDIETEWEKALVDVLLPAQTLDGSFPVICQHAEAAGDSAADRSFTTALCLLSLQLHYRQWTPMLGK